MQVSLDLLGDSDVAEQYKRVLGTKSPEGKTPDVRLCYLYPLLAAEEAPQAPVPPEYLSAAFEQCLRVYQTAAEGHAVVQSEHGNFLLARI